MLLASLLIGSLALIANMLIQIVVTVAIIGYLLHLLDSGRLLPTMGTDIKLHHFSGSFLRPCGAIRGLGVPVPVLG